MIIKFPLILTVALFFAFTSQSSIEAQDRQTLSARAKQKQHGVTFRKKMPFTRVDDNGRPLVLWSQQAVYRATNDTFIYRSQNKATTRHDEVSSHAIMFHTKGGQVRPGHVYTNRGN